MCYAAGPVLITLQVPPDNHIGPEFVENILDAVHRRMAGLRDARVILGFIHSVDGTKLFCRFPRELQPVLQGGLYGAYPATTITTHTDEAALGPAANRQIIERRLWLSPDIYPIRRFRQFQTPDSEAPALPMATLLQCVASAPNALVELAFRPTDSRRRQRMMHLLEHLHHPSVSCRPHLQNQLTKWATGPSRMIRLLSAIILRLLVPRRDHHVLSATETSVDPSHRMESDLLAASDKLSASHLFEVSLTLTVGIEASGDRQAAIAALDSIESTFAPFARQRRVHWRRVRSSHKVKRGFLLTSEEIATIWHPPLGNVRSEQLAASEFTELEPPGNLPSAKEEGTTVLGRVCFRARGDVVAIRPWDRARHLHIIGKTGTGKSTLLHNLIQSDMEQGRGVCLVDPHGDLAEALIASIPKSRTRDAVILDPGDVSHPVALNFLDCPRRRLRPLVASGVVSAFKKLNESWGPRLEDLLRNAVLVCLEHEGATLMSLLRLLTDDRIRSDLTRTIEDPIAREFWQQEFAAWDRRHRTEAVSAVTNKVRPFLSSEYIRNIVSQPRGKVKLREIMDDGRIVIVKLSKGIIGEDMCNVFGAMLLTKLQIDAMSRADSAEHERRPFMLFVDEFQNFVTDSFSTMLSEARKYGLSLTLSHQYIEQLGDERAAVFGNVDNLLCFRTGAEDSEAMSEEFGRAVDPRDLTRLPAHTAYLRMLVGGQPTRPFTITTSGPLSLADGMRTRMVRNYSRNRYATSLERLRSEVSE